MAALPLTGVVNHVRALAGDEFSDRELLQRFTAAADETAFAALVRRHGPLVLGVCRRLLNHHDAEDACQTVFMILARKSGGRRSLSIPWAKVIRL